MTRPPMTTAAESSGPMRLNRFLARAGIASRRHSDELIAAGAVKINGAPPTGPGDRVDPAKDRVEVKGRGLVSLPQVNQYMLLNKRRDTLVTKADDRGRRTIYDGLTLRPGTVAVGRLDRDTTGALLLTDDGELAHRLMHPSYGAEKRYVAIVRGQPSHTALRRLREGVQLDDGPTAPARVQRLHDDDEGRARLELILKEGRKHQVKRMCETVGHQVMLLRRESFAGLDIRSLAQGTCRPLRPREVNALRTLVGLPKD
jgi:23S rRNA pseudouridine2605 synthase